MTFKKLEVSESICDNPQLQQGVNRANDFLEEELGQSAGIVAVSWDATNDDRDRSLVSLKIADFSGSVSAQIASDELADEARLRWRLRRVWGDLLQDRSRRQLEKLHRVVQELESE